MSALYEGCWHKLDWAKQHVDALKHDIGTWMAGPNRELLYRWRQEFDSDTNSFPLIIDAVAGPPIEWSLTIGDALTNFRAALDYLAHDLVGRGSRPELKGGNVPQFVICRNVNDAKGQINGRLPGIKPRHRAVIEDFQPYYWLEWSELHPLALLDTFVRWDKHREIEPVFSQHIGTFGVTVISARDFVVERTELGRGFVRSYLPRLEPNTEIARLFGRKVGPNPHVVVRFHSTYGIAFKNGLWVEHTLDRIGTMIAELFTRLEPIL